MGYCTDDLLKLGMLRTRYVETMTHTRRNNDVSFPVSMERKSAANSQACERIEITRNHFPSSFDTMAGNERATFQSPGSANRSMRICIRFISGLDHKSVETSFNGHEAWSLGAGIVHWR
jgi:hypothetical protein